LKEGLFNITRGNWQNWLTSWEDGFGKCWPTVNGVSRGNECGDNALVEIAVGMGKTEAEIGAALG